MDPSTKTPDLRSSELIKDHRHNQYDQHSNNRNRYNPIRSHPTQQSQVSKTPLPFPDKEDIGEATNLRAIPLSVFTLLST